MQQNYVDATFGRVGSDSSRDLVYPLPATHEEYCQIASECEGTGRKDSQMVSIVYQNARGPGFASLWVICLLVLFQVTALLIKLGACLIAADYSNMCAKPCMLCFDV